MEISSIVNMTVGFLCVFTKVGQDIAGNVAEHEDDQENGNKGLF